VIRRLAAEGTEGWTPASNAELAKRFPPAPVEEMLQLQREFISIEPPALPQS